LTDNVTDIAPVRALTELRYLNCSGAWNNVGKMAPFADLSPLKGMKLTRLDCFHTQVSDLSPLQGMPLTYLSCYVTRVTDLTPLKDMKLTSLTCRFSKVTDLSPLKGMPLEALDCDFEVKRDAEILRSIKTLEKINGKTKEAFWKDVDQKKP
jgi:Leucine-rich repeat (LRR) protein